MKELISIIVPVYNVEAYLRRCLDSLIHQTYHNIEIILVNDGSLDRSGEICEVYAKQDERIRVIHQQNAGPSAARNRALESALGEYICFVDADDYVSWNYVEILYSLLRDQSADMAICEFQKFMDEAVTKKDIEKKTVSTEEIEQKILTNIELIQNMHQVAGELYVVMWGKLFRKDLLTDIYFPEGRICEDLAVLYQIYDRIQQAVYGKVVLYYYFRNRKESATYDLQEKFYQDVYLALEEEMDYLQIRHPELLNYPRKTYLYWLFDHYRKLWKTEHKKLSLQGKQLLKQYRKLYRASRGVKKEGFYTVFYVSPKLYFVYQFLKMRKHAVVK